MTGENQKLRDMLSHVSNNYSALQMHLVTLMQQQTNQAAEDEVLSVIICYHHNYCNITFGSNC